MYTEYDNEGNYTQDEKPDRKKLYIIIGVIIGLLLLIWLFFFSGWIKFGYGARVKSISINMKTLGLKPKDTYQLYAEVKPTNAKNKTITWYSSDSNIAEVDEKTGMVTAVAVGKAIITVQSKDNKNVSSDCVVTVSDALTDVTGIEFTSEAITIYRGSGELLEVRVLPETAKTPVLKFTSSNPNVVKVNDIGYITGVAVGTATVMVQTEDGKFSDTITVTVKAGGGSTIINPTSISFGADSVDVVLNQTVNLAVNFLPTNATNRTLTWASTDASIVRVNNGAITGLKIGKTTVKATTVNNLTASITVNVIASPIPVTGITVSPTTVSLKVGGTRQITPKVEPDNASNKEVTYISSDIKVATVTEAGLIKAIAKGSATITVKTKDQNKTATVAVAVTDDSAGGGTSNPPGGGGSSSGGTDYVSITGINASGPMEIINGTSVNLSVSVTPGNTALANMPTCTSSNTTYITTSGSVRTDTGGCTLNAKKVTPKDKPVTITIKATDRNGNTKSKSVKVSVIDGAKPTAITSIAMTSSVGTLEAGYSSTFKAAVSPSNADLYGSITWKTSDASVATVSGSGTSAKITAIKVGTAYISAVAVDRYGKSVYAQVKLSVYSRYIDSTKPNCGDVRYVNTSSAWSNSSKTITVSCTDNASGSGCSQGIFSKTFTSNAINGTITISDKAGNTKDCTVSVNIDKTSPNCSITTPAGTGTGKTITVTGSDSLSGVKTTKIGTSSGGTVASQTFSSTGTFTGTVIDNAGNQKQCSLTLTSRKEYRYRTCSTCKRCKSAGIEACAAYSYSNSYCYGSNITSTKISTKIKCTFEAPGTCSYSKPYYCKSYYCSAYTYKKSCSSCGCNSWNGWSDWSTTSKSSSSSQQVETRNVYYQAS